MLAFVLPNGGKPPRGRVQELPEPEPAPDDGPVQTFTPPQPRPVRLTYRQAVEFYTSPDRNPDMGAYLERLFSKSLTFEEKQMLFYTVESISQVLYAVYDHLYFHTYERMFDIGRKQALKEMAERESKILEALEPVVDVFFQRADSYRARLDVPCSPAFSEVLSELETTWKQDIGGLWRALPKETA